MKGRLQKAIDEQVGKAFSIYNAFLPVEEDRNSLQQLRLLLRDSEEAAKISFGSVTHEIPLKLLDYMTASAEHIGDMCILIFDSNESEKVIKEQLGKTFDVYNAFLPGEEGEDCLLGLRNKLRQGMKGGSLEGIAKISCGSIVQEIPLKLLGYMMASAKHLGDMCIYIAKAT